MLFKESLFLYFALLGTTDGTVSNQKFDVYFNGVSLLPASNVCYDEKSGTLTICPESSKANECTIPKSSTPFQVEVSFIIPSFQHHENPKEYWRKTITPEVADSRICIQEPFWYPLDRLVIAEIFLHVGDAFGIVVVFSGGHPSPPITPTEKPSPFPEREKNDGYGQYTSVPAISEPQDQSPPPSK